MLLVYRSCVLHAHCNHEHLVQEYLRRYGTLLHHLGPLGQRLGVYGEGRLARPDTTEGVWDTL